MTTYELSYFNATGRAESIRVMLHAAGINFKDNRFSGPEWPAIKPTTPLGGVPTLKIDDVTYCQSVALVRYASKLAGFYPEDPLQALVVDEALDSCNEIMSLMPKDADEEEKKKKRKEWQEGALTRFANFIESRIQASGGTRFVKEPSIADLFISGLVDGMKAGYFDYIDTDFFDKYPGIIGTSAAIKDHPKVKAYHMSKE